MIGQTCTVYDCDPRHPKLSATRRPNVLVPPAEGVPESVPPVESVNPGGTFPLDRLHVMGADPVEVPNAWLNDVPSFRTGSVVGVMLITGHTTEV